MSCDSVVSIVGGGGDVDKVHCIEAPRSRVDAKRQKTHPQPPPPPKCKTHHRPSFQAQDAAPKNGYVASGTYGHVWTPVCSHDEPRIECDASPPSYTSVVKSMGVNSVSTLEAALYSSGRLTGIAPPLLGLEVFVVQEGVGCVRSPTCGDPADAGTRVDMTLMRGEEFYYVPSRTGEVDPRNRKWSFSELAQVSMDLASRLRALHEVGITHLDLKPNNIVLQPRRDWPDDSSPRTWLIDFGSSMCASRLTFDGVCKWASETYDFCTTYVVRAPETWSNSRWNAATGHGTRVFSALRSVDAYALGATLFFTITDTFPVQWILDTDSDDRSRPPNREKRRRAAFTQICKTAISRLYRHHDSDEFATAHASALRSPLASALKSRSGAGRRPVGGDAWMAEFQDIVLGLLQTRPDDRLDVMMAHKRLCALAASSSSSTCDPSSVTSSSSSNVIPSPPPPRSFVIELPKELTRWIVACFTIAVGSTGRSYGADLISACFFCRWVVAQQHAAATAMAFEDAANACVALAFMVLGLDENIETESQIIPRAVLSSSLTTSHDEYIKQHGVLMKALETAVRDTANHLNFYHRRVLVPKTHIAITMRTLGFDLWIDVPAPLLRNVLHLKTI